jgi:hypothetical protein
MIDPVEDICAPAAIERALCIFRELREQDQSVIQQARKILTQHIYAMIDKGEYDEQRLTVSGLARLKSIERDHAIKSAHGTPTKKRIRRSSISSESQICVLPAPADKYRSAFSEGHNHTCEFAGRAN